MTGLNHGMTVNRMFNSQSSIMNKFLFSIILIMICSSAFGTTVKKLYEISIPVYSQSSKERKEAITKAFEELLIKVTGKKDIGELEEGQALLKKSHRYIRSFRYEAIEKKTTENLESDAVGAVDEQGFDTEIKNMPAVSVAIEAEEPQPEQNLIISFDEKAVKNSLWRSKLPVWGKTRPATLVWLAVQDQNSRRLIDSSESLPLLEYMSKYAYKRGVPIVYPLLDLEDQINLNVTDVWGGFKDSVISASERYQPEAIVAARLYQDPFGIWESRWSFYQDSEELQWRSSAPDQDTAIQEGIDYLADKLAEHYAHVPTSGNENSTLITISDVNNLADYDKVSRYLSSLSAIKKVFVSQVQMNEVIYQLDLRGSKNALKQAISLSKVLVEVEDPFAIDLPESRFNYRLMP